MLPMTTIQDRVAAARQILRQAGIGPAEADLSARRLAEHVLGWDTARYFTSSNEAEPSKFAESYDALVARRAAREPSAYITGLQEFWDLSFEVSPSVLIPRPETELIIETALDELGSERGRQLAIADAGTGCGCLAVALAREFSQAGVVATDISEAALIVARRNARRHGVADRIRFLHANMLDRLDILDDFDLIVANPPYVRQGDRRALQPEVRDYEPGVALFGGDSGFDLVVSVVAQAAGRLRPGALLIFEFGFGQDDAVEELIANTPGITLVELRRDLQGIARTAVARRV
jgi:release factor glutamine methyltransferase